MYRCNMHIYAYIYIYICIRLSHVVRQRVQKHCEMFHSTRLPFAHYILQIQEYHTCTSHTCSFSPAPSFSLLFRMPNIRRKRKHAQLEHTHEIELQMLDTRASEVRAPRGINQMQGVHQEGPVTLEHMGAIGNGNTAVTVSSKVGRGNYTNGRTHV